MEEQKPKNFIVVTVDLHDDSVFLEIIKKGDLWGAMKKAYGDIALLGTTLFEDERKVFIDRVEEVANSNRAFYEKNPHKKNWDVYEKGEEDPWFLATKEGLRIQGYPLFVSDSFDTAWFLLDMSEGSAFLIKNSLS